MTALAFFCPSANVGEPASEPSEDSYPNHCAQLSDQEREQHIADLGRLIQKAYARFQESGCTADRTEAAHYVELQTQAILSRSPEQVARMVARIEADMERGSCYFAGTGDIMRLRGQQAEGAAHGR